MGYFRELPNLLYQSFLPSKNSSLDYIEVKNLFRRVKLRDDLQNVFIERFESATGLNYYDCWDSAILHIIKRGIN